MRRGKGLRPFPHTPFLASASLPPLRSGQVFLDEAEHLFHNRGASDAALRGLFAFGPECPSRSLRNHPSPSPESSNWKGFYRKRTGGYRIIFFPNHQDRITEVSAIVTRAEKTYR
jgi:hypothetical protein